MLLWSLLLYPEGQLHRPPLCPETLFACRPSVPGGLAQTTGVSSWAPPPPSTPFSLTCSPPGQLGGGTWPGVLPLDGPALLKWETAALSRPVWTHSSEMLGQFLQGVQVEMGMVKPADR